MILLDTNVVLEVMRPSPSGRVIAWLNEQASDQLFVSAITVGEIVYGLRILAEGYRRLGLSERFERFLALAFDQRILPYDERAARQYGDLMGACKERGRPMSVPDGQIAAIARANQLMIATRNVTDFAHSGVDLVDPFDAPK